MAEWVNLKQANELGGQREPEDVLTDGASKTARQTDRHPPADVAALCDPSLDSPPPPARATYERLSLLTHRRNTQTKSTTINRLLLWALMIEGNICAVRNMEDVFLQISPSSTSAWPSSSRISLSTFSYSVLFLITETSTVQVSTGTCSSVKLFY